MNIQERIGQVIVKLRKSRNISQERLALETSIARHYMSDIENGKRSVSVEVVEKIAHFFDMSLSDFFREVENI